MSQEEDDFRGEVLLCSANDGGIVPHRKILNS